ncbi:MAG: hypothetical protein HY744_22290 [Deltaproteobacteria bacterium]|nr:hypothetical protein [Deltaproteobacteria bacterium]
MLPARPAPGGVLAAALFAAGCHFVGGWDEFRVGSGDGGEPDDGGPGSAGGALIWARRLGGSGMQVPRGLCVDSGGNAVVAGYFYESLDLGELSLTSAGNDDPFVVKLGADGGYRWSRSYGDGAEQHATAVAVDGSDNVVLAGSFDGSVDFGGGALPNEGSPDIFLVKLDPNGEHLWSQRFGGADSHQYAFDVAVDPLGNIVLVGELQGSVDFGGGALASEGTYDVFVARFTAAGKHQWSRRYGDLGHQTGRAVAFDGSHNVVVAGYFTGSIDLGDGPLVAQGALGGFAAKLDPNGDALWSAAFAGGSVYPKAVAVDGTGGVVVDGYFFDRAELGGEPLAAAGEKDKQAFVAKLDSAGQHLWSRGFGDGTEQHAAGVAVDSTGAVLLAGGFDGTVSFGGPALANAGARDIFAAKLGPEAEHVWSRRFGDLYEQAATGVATDGDANVFVAGYFGGAIDFGAEKLTSAGGFDVFLVKLRP